MNEPKSRKYRLSEYLAKKTGDIAASMIITLALGTALAMIGVGVVTQDPKAALEVPSDVWTWGTNMNNAAIKYTNAP